MDTPVNCSDICILVTVVLYTCGVCIPCAQLTCERELAGGFRGGSDQSLSRPVNTENVDTLISEFGEGKKRTIEYLQQLIYSLRTTAEGLVLYSTS